MRATVGCGDHHAVGSAPDHEVLAQQRARQRTAGDVAGAGHRVPVATKDRVVEEHSHPRSVRQLSGMVRPSDQMLSGAIPSVPAGMLGR